MLQKISVGARCTVIELCSFFTVLIFVLVALDRRDERRERARLMRADKNYFRRRYYDDEKHY
jgi:hypothetical protein